ncbi:MAG: hypothetical protein HYY10_01405 [Candidatus Liptonbacteria bacterium]|nr:hypothetical protein [Candidatus Liptonbacteria bacterium]
MSSSAEMQRAGAEYTEFVRNRYRMKIQTVDVLRDTDELTIQIPGLPRPTLEELREKFPGIKVEGGIERDGSLIKAGMFKLGTVLLPDEMEEQRTISGRAFESRIVAKRDALYGYQHGVWIVEHQDEFPALKLLLGKVYILLPGLVVVGGGGYRCVFCLGRGGKRWYVRWICLTRDVGSSARAAFSGE